MNACLSITLNESTPSGGNISTSHSKELLQGIDKIKKMDKLNRVDPARPAALRRANALHDLQTDAQPADVIRYRRTPNFARPEALRNIHIELNNRFELMCPSDSRVGQMVLKPVARPVFMNVTLPPDLEILQQSAKKGFLQQPNHTRQAEAILLKMPVNKGRLTDAEHYELSTHMDEIENNNTLDLHIKEDHLNKNLTLQGALQRLKFSLYYKSMFSNYSKPEISPISYAMEGLVDRRQLPEGISSRGAAQIENIQLQRFSNATDRRSRNYEFWKNTAGDFPRAQAEIDNDKREAENHVKEMSRA